MANKFFKCVVRLDKVQADGLIKKVSETYLVDALSHTEAEKRVTDEVSQFASGEFEVYSITRANIAEVLRSEESEAESYFQTTIGLITIDEKTEKERLTKQRMLVQAVDFDDAVARVREEMKKWMASVVTLELKLTPYIDYLEYKR